jgi:hypothetical protein
MRSAPAELTVDSVFTDIRCITARLAARIALCALARTSLTIALPGIRLRI